MPSRALRPAQWSPRLSACSSHRRSAQAPSLCLSICQAAYRSSQARSLGGQGVRNQFPPSFSHHRVESKISHVSGCVCARPVTSVMSDSSATSWTIVRQAPLWMGFSQQEYWSELPWPLSRESSQPRDRTHISCVSCTLQADSLLLSHRVGEASKLSLGPGEGQLQLTAPLGLGS